MNNPSSLLVTDFGDEARPDVSEHLICVNPRRIELTIETKGRGILLLRGGLPTLVRASSSLLKAPFLLLLLRAFECFDRLFALSLLLHAEPLFLIHGLLLLNFGLVTEADFLSLIVITEAFADVAAIFGLLVLRTGLLFWLVI